MPFWLYSLECTSLHALFQLLIGCNMSLDALDLISDVSYSKILSLNVAL
jgi:hypothetical protein